MGTFPPYHLEGLSDIDCWSLFEQRAFLDGVADPYHSLVSIGKEILKKCRGLPLAAKTLGGLLHGKTKDYEWEMILRSDIWDLDEEENEILPALRLSYYHLPAHLKHCFMYCSIFPKDYNFDKETLALLWMAEGFVLSKGKRCLEDVALAYFDDLLLRSFFQQSKTNPSKFLMHDLIHDLAQDVADEICFTLEGEKSKNISEKARHASVLVSTATAKSIPFEALYTAKGLRTTLLLGGMNPHEIPSLNLPHDLLPSLKCLRSLDLSYSTIKELPVSIGNSRHIRYLDLSHTSIKGLPESIRNLYNLQTLLLHHCIMLLALPDGTNDLVNLRYLSLTGCWHLISMPPCIGQLTCLGRLDRFIVGKGNGCGISQLKDMNDLRATLCIDRLEDVHSITEAMEANLKKKQNLQELVLRWNRNRPASDGIDEGLLECLEPHNNIENLKIDVYSGSKFPNWMGDSSLYHLEKIELIHCNYCKSLPPFGQLPLLKDLSVNVMYKLESIGRGFYGQGKIKGFPSLEKLKLQHMRNFKEWQEIDQGEFPVLRELIVLNWPSIASLPKFPSLRQLLLDDCHDAILSSVHFLTSLSSLKVSNFRRTELLPEGLLRPLDALEELKIQNFHRLEAMQEEMGLHDLRFLQRLEISCCPRLVSFPLKGLPPTLQYLSIGLCSNLKTLPDGLQNLTSLQELDISKCPKLESFPEEKLTTSLKNLSISGCANLESLPVGLHEVSNLEHLSITSCQKMASLPVLGLPASLRSLFIMESALLQERCKDGGEDWDKIAHIPYKWISEF